MGSGPSQEDYDRSASTFYQVALSNPCLLPDISIDKSLQSYSGLDSNAVLQSYSDGMIGYVPQFIEKFGSITPIPNAVGLGAFVLSMLIEICSNAATQTGDDSFSIIRRVFGEEKASAVRDTMTEYLRRHQTFMKNNQRLREELQRLEQQLSKDLTVLRNSLLHDRQMSTRGFKIWVNGASFHLQMLIHEARLNPQANYVNRIKSTISLYLQDLNQLLETYPTHQGSVRIDNDMACYPDVCIGGCHIKSDKCKIEVFPGSGGISGGSKVNEAFMRLIVKDIRPALDNHFINIRNSLTSLINQHDSFTLSYTA
ncbi:hypothetical protein GBF38_006653 [Nibea albiflora]|uniref:Uncharacterized protein n=1 Tax=Nibea albiflora TaxID=240163 RepID=A0ACB7EH75_NIBAL|nr:hypothetical protein GBF38_006653 [Nibea albiflora]